MINGTPRRTLRWVRRHRYDLILAIIATATAMLAGAALAWSTVPPLPGCRFTNNATTTDTTYYEAACWGGAIPTWIAPKPPTPPAPPAPISRT